MAENKKTEATAKAQDKKNKKPSFLDKVKGFFGRIVKYFKDTKSELKKVVWPSKKDVKTNTVTVIIGGAHPSGPDLWRRHSADDRRLTLGGNQWLMNRAGMWCIPIPGTRTRSRRT